MGIIYFVEHSLKYLLVSGGEKKEYPTPAEVPITALCIFSNAQYYAHQNALTRWVPIQCISTFNWRYKYEGWLPLYYTPPGQEFRALLRFTTMMPVYYTLCIT